MGKLFIKQATFTRKIGLLIHHAYLYGYDLTLGDCYRDNRCDYGHPKSTHRSRLAVDFNVGKDGNLLTGREAEEAHNFLHDYWDILEGAKRIKQDLNHYSFKHNGVR